MLDGLARRAHWGTGEVETYPKNMTEKNFVYFCFLSPTLFYQPSFSACYWSGEIARDLVRAGVNKKATAGGPLAGKTALHYAAGMGYVDVARELLGEGYLETDTDDEGCRPGCLIGKAWTEKNAAKDRWMRRLLALGPAFRACSWLWPRKSATETAVNDSTGKQGKVRNRAKKKKTVPVDLGVLRHRRRPKDTLKLRKDTMKTFARRVGAIHCTQYKDYSSTFLDVRGAMYT